MIIAIDGPAGSGKSSTAKALAQKLGFQVIDTGAMYRVVTLKALRKNVAFTDDTQMGEITRNTKIEFIGVVPNVRVIMDGEDVSEEIRSDKVTKNVSDYCAVNIVREILVEQQRQIAKGKNSIAEGRDMTTVVFPNAEVKIFMIADLIQRAKRRLIDFEKLGVQKTVEEIAQDLGERDLKDSTRKNSPLKKADGAVLIDTTNLKFDEQVEIIANLAREIEKK